MSLKIKDKKQNRWKKATSMLAGSHKVVDYDNNYDSENVEGCLREIAQDMKKMQSHIKYIYQNGTIGGGSGGGGGSSVPTITIDGVADSDGIFRRVVKSDEDVVIYYFFNSPNVGNGTVRLANGDTVIEQTIKQGRNKWNAGRFSRGTYNLSISVEDQQGFVSEPARIQIISGAIEITSTFSAAKDFNLQDNISIPYRVATEITDPLTAHLTLGDTVTEKNINKGDNAWEIGSLPLGVHEASIKVVSETATSNILNYNLVVADSDSLFLSTTFKESTFPQGKRLQIDYRISMKGQYSFKSELYLDGVLKETVNNGPGVSYWDLGTELPLGPHTFRIVSMTPDKQYKDEITIEAEIIEAGLIQIQEPQGMIFKFNASGKMNDSDNNNIWEDRTGNGVQCTLHGFNYITNGWLTDEETDETALTFAGKAYAEIDLAPFLNGIETGFTFDIVYKSNNTGNTDARVVECKNPFSPFQGFMIDSEKAVFEARQGVKAYFGEDKWVRTTFVIDRLSRQMRVYTNAVISNGAILGDKDPTKDEFQYNGKIILGAGLDETGKKIINNSTSAIKVIRGYNRALTDREVLDLHMFDIRNADELNQIHELNFGELTIPTLEITGLGIEKLEGNMDPLTVRISYRDPLNPSKRLDRDFCQLEIQGTTSKDYPIKNYTLYMRDQQAQADRTWTPNDDWMPEERWTLKTNFMDSSHANNVGINKFIHDVFKENPYPQQIGEKGTKRRSNVDGFPTKLYINGKDCGIYTFNIDRYAYNNYGLSDYNDDSTVNKHPNAVQYEVAVNSTNGSGAFLNDTWDNIRREWKHRYNYRNGSATTKIGSDTVLADGMHSELQDMISWVCNADDNTFISELDDWFSIPHLIDYYLIAYAFGMIDNLGKNMVMTTFGQNESGNTIWYPSFYDCDSILGLANNGEIRYDAGVDMSSEAFNTRNSALWVKLKRNFEQQIQNRYYELRAERKLPDGTTLPPIFSAENVMSYLDDELMSKIGQSYYNNDAQRKYFDGRTLGEENNPDAPRPGQTWMQCCNGNRKEFTERWLAERFKYLDSVFQTNNYTAKTMILRTHVLGPVKLKLKSYSPQWFTIKYSSSSTERVYVNRDRDYEFNVEITNDTENDFTIYGADNLMYLKGMDQLFISHMNIAGAEKLVEVDCNNSPNIKGISIGSHNKYLQRVIAHDCKQLGLEIENKAINLTGCPNLKEVNISNTLIKEVSLPTSGGVIEVLNCENTLLERFDLMGQEYLEELQLSGCSNLAEVYLSNCNGLIRVEMPNTILTTFSISNCKNIEVIDISNTARLTSLDLRGCPNLRELNLTGVVSKNIKDLDLTSSLKLEKLILENMSFIDCVTFGRYVDENDELHNFNALKHFNCKNSSIRTIRYGINSVKPDMLDLSGLNLEYITFESCINVAHIKGINLVAKGSMAPFKNCRNLTTIEGSVTLKDSINMAFYGCKQLTGLTKGNKLILDLTNVTSISETFSGCSSLTMDDLKFIMSKFSSKLNGTTWRAFTGCIGIRGSLPSNLFAKTTGMTSLNEYFSGCTGITGQLPADLLKPMTKLRDCEETFLNCTGITGNIPENFFAGPGSSLQITKHMFANCVGIEDIPSNNLFSSNPNIKNTSYMFSGCTGITGKVPGTIFKGREKLESVEGFFRNCSGVWGEIPRTIFRHCTNSRNSVLKYISYFFEGTSVEGEIPRYISDSDKGLFDDLPYLENASKVFPTTISGTIPPNLFKYNPRLSEVNYLFDGCTMIEGSIPETLLAGKDQLKSANGLFRGCTGINSIIPRRLFEGCVVLTDIKEIFSGCKSLTGQIPARVTRTIQVPSEENPDEMIEVVEIVEYGLFDYATSIRNAAGVFCDCIKLNGNIPEELFVAGNQIEDLSNAFARCYELSGPIPAGLLKNCRSLLKASSMFLDCCKLGRSDVSITEDDPWAVPPELFENCKELIDASNCFYMWGQNKPQESVLKGKISPLMLRNNRKLKNVSGMFTATPVSGEVPGNLFLTNTSLENASRMFTATRVTSIGSGFLSNSPNIKTVEEMFWQSSQISGAVPELWNIGGLVGTRCYAGLSSSKVTNWRDIPDNWK